MTFYYSNDLNNVNTDANKNIYAEFINGKISCNSLEGSHISE